MQTKSGREAEDAGGRVGLSLEPLEKRIMLQADWTFMVYLDADNNLESAGIDDFLEMAHIGSNADVNIVAQFDRIGGFDTTYDDWTDTRRGLISHGDVPDTGWGASIGEQNMGDGSVLSSFVSWAMGNYTADHYALMLWDHGAGWPEVCIDSTDGDSLATAEVTTAIETALATVPGVSQLDLLGFDACLMGMLEVAHGVQDVAHVMVGSQGLVPWDGMPYDDVLEELVASPEMSASEFGQEMAQDYYSYYAGSGVTIATLDLAEVGDISDAVDDFASEMQANSTSEDRAIIAGYRSDATYYGTASYRDLGLFANGVANDADVTASIRNAAEDTVTELTGAVLAYYSDATMGSGLSIYFPERGGTLDPTYATDLDFADDTQWDEFLTWWTAGPDVNWTFMVYMCADNNLEGYALEDFLEMASVGSTDDVNILIQLDRGPGVSTAYNDWEDTRRGLVNLNDVPDDLWGLSLGEVNMGDQGVLADFVDWSVTNYAAQNYALVLWDHGGGWDGVCWDDTSFDHLALAEVGGALDDVGEQIDLLRLDACSVGMLEMAYEVAGNVDIMVGSEDSMWLSSPWGYLTPYDSILSAMVDDPAMTSVELGELSAQEYYYAVLPLGTYAQQWYGSRPTNSVVDVAGAGILAGRMDDLATALLTDGTVTDRVALDEARHGAMAYPNTANSDLGQILQGLASDGSLTSSVRDAAGAALVAYNDAVLANYAEAGQGTGLSIYFPEGRASFDSEYDWDTVAFADDTQWDEMLDWLYAEYGPVATFQNGTARVTFYDMMGVGDIDPSDIQVAFNGNAVSAIRFGGSSAMAGLGIVISGASQVGTIEDGRSDGGLIYFVASDAPVTRMNLGSDIWGENLNGRLLGGLLFPMDIDGDGSMSDRTGLYVDGALNDITVDGTLYSDLFIDGDLGGYRGGTDAAILSDFVVTGDVGQIGLTGGALDGAHVQIGGSLDSLHLDGGWIGGAAAVDVDGYIGEVEASVMVGGDVFSGTPGATIQSAAGIGSIHLGSISTTILFDDEDIETYGPTYGDSMVNILAPNIDDVVVDFSVYGGRILAGAHFGDDYLPGGTGDAADTYTVGHIGTVEIGEHMWDSLIAAGVNQFGWDTASGYNLATLRDGGYFIDGSTIDSVDVGGFIYSSYNDSDYVGDPSDFTRAVFVPYGIGAYAITDGVRVRHHDVPIVSVPPFMRHPYVIVETPYDFYF